MEKKYSILKLIFLVISWMLVSGIVQAVTPLNGDWVGAINVNGQNLGITIHFKGDIDNFRAIIDIPSQGVKNYSLKNIKIEGKKISMELPSQVVGVFSGELKNNEITGDYTQGVVSGSFYLQKIDDCNVKNETGDEKKLSLQEVTLEVDDGILYGTLQLPEGEYLLESRKRPVALIIAGSGPTDRNGNSPVTGENNSLKMLSERLAEAGIASLRYDKRMVAESSGIETSEVELRFSDYINDAVGWIKKLQDDNRFSVIYVIGHSQGSLVGMVAVRKANADGFISIAGPGQTIDRTLKEQLSSLEGELREEAYSVLNSLRSGETVPDVDFRLNSLFKPSIQPFLISYMKYDPQVEIAKLGVPVLIIQGTTDLQVTIEDSRRLKNANEEAKLIIIEGMNHVLKKAQAELNENIATYSKPDLPLIDGLVEEVIKFIKEQ